MNKLFFISTLFFLCSCWINVTYSKLSSAQKEERAIPISLTEFQNSKNKRRVVDLNSNSFATLLSENQDQTVIFYELATWCKPCMEGFDQNLDSLNQLANTKIILYTADDWISTNRYQEFIQEKKLDRPVFMLSIQEYGTMFNSKKRFEHFFKETVCADCEIIYGLPKFLLFKNKEYVNTFIEVEELQKELDILN